MSQTEEISKVGLPQIPHSQINYEVFDKFSVQVNKSVRFSMMNFTLKFSKNNDVVGYFFVFESQKQFSVIFLFFCIVKNLPL